MILVDTSVWVDLLGPKPRFVVPVEKMPLLAICPPIVQEIMQGVSHAKARTQIYQGLMSLSMYGNPMALELYLDAADIFSRGRQKGLTIRSSTDCLIAAVARAFELTVWHRDRDFDHIARFTDIQTLKDLR